MQQEIEDPSLQLPGDGNEGTGDNTAGNGAGNDGTRNDETDGNAENEVKS
jgi:hypothetical protein